MPNRRQAIIWINADPIHWRIYAALGGDELKNTSVNVVLHCLAHIVGSNNVLMPNRRRPLRVLMGRIYWPASTTAYCVFRPQWVKNPSIPWTSWSLHLTVVLYVISSMFLILWDRDKVAASLRRFSIAVSEIKWWHFEWDFIEICSLSLI